MGLSAEMQVSDLDSILRMTDPRLLWCLERNHGAFGTRLRLGRVFLSFLKGFLAVGADAMSVMDEATLGSFHIFAEKWQFLKLSCMPGRLAFQLTMAWVNTWALMELS